MSNIVEFRNVTRKYVLGKKEIKAVNDVSFSIKQGQFVVIAGHSGSGKSTILQMMSGLETPNSGSIMVSGNEISRMTNADLTKMRRNDIGIIFQNFYLEQELTLRQNIELPAMFANIRKDVRKKRTAELTQATELSEHLDHRPAELSGGQIQRAAILRAIYNNPKIIVADEPTSNLDNQNANNVLKILKRLQDESGATIVIATHDNKVLPFADRVIEMKNGAIL
ncbi:MAG: ABC transporter ATP-binding protein [Candidatus Saccharimonadales bacterium]